MGAADHLVHGMGTALEAPTWPAITHAEAEAILAGYPAVGQPAGLLWHSPRPFSAAALVEATEGTFLLKRHHRTLRSTTALAEEHGFMVHLRDAGLAVPEVISATGGAGAIAQGEWTYELHRQSHGIDLYRDRPSWTPFLNHDHAFAAGAALARLHVAAQGFAAPARGPHPLVASFTIVSAADPLAAAETYVAARPALAAFLADKDWRREMSRLFSTVGRGLSARLENQPALWTHNDWHPSNLLWSEDGTVRTVIDFGLATRTCALHDLANAIERTAIPWLEPDYGPPDPQSALAIVSGYRSVLPLSNSDVETVVRLLPLVHIEFALSEIDYFAGIVCDPDQAALAWDGYVIGHAEWFAGPVGRAFLDNIERGAVT